MDFILVSALTLITLSALLPKYEVVDFKNYNAVCQELLKRSKTEKLGNKKRQYFDNHFENILNKDSFKDIYDELGCQVADDNSKKAYAFHEKNRHACELSRDDMYSGRVSQEEFESYVCNRCNKNPFISSLDRELIQKAYNLKE